MGFSSPCFFQHEHTLKGLSLGDVGLVWPHRFPDGSAGREHVASSGAGPESLALKP